jgi:uncharacterized Zn-binding protein involved in type VI secretion
MANKGVARINIDHAGGLIATGADSVQVNNRATAVINGSTIGGPPNAGDVIVSTPSMKVFAENQPVAVLGSVTAKGFTVGKSSPNVFAGP